MEMARCLRSDANISKNFWPYAVRYAQYLRNRSYQRRTKSTAYELFTGRKPDMKNLHPFRAQCVMYKESTKGKLDARGIDGIFLGINPINKGYYVLNQAKNSIATSCNVYFRKQEIDETYYPCKLPEKLQGHVESKQDLETKTAEGDQHQSNEHSNTELGTKPSSPPRGGSWWLKIELQTSLGILLWYLMFNQRKDFAKRSGLRPALSPTVDPGERAKCARNHNFTKQRTQENEKLKIGTWNVRGTNKQGKLQIIVEQMAKQNVGILGMAETFWKGETSFTMSATIKNEKYTVMMKGGEKSRKGVGFIMTTKIEKMILETEGSRDSILRILLDTKPVETLLIQIYMPTSDCEEQISLEFYEEIEKVIGRLGGRKNRVVIVMGNFNAMVGDAEVDGIVGAFLLVEGMKRDSYY